MGFLLSDTFGCGLWGPAGNRWCTQTRQFDESLAKEPYAKLFQLKTIYFESLMVLTRDHWVDLAWDFSCSCSYLGLM